MVVTFTANCYFYRIFWAVIGLVWSFFGLVLGLFYEEIRLVFQPASGNTGAICACHVVQTLQAKPLCVCVYLFMGAVWLVTDGRVGVACDNPYG